MTTVPPLAKKLPARMETQQCATHLLVSKVCSWHEADRLKRSKVCFERLTDIND